MFFFSALHRLPRDHFIWKKMFVFSLFEANKSQLHIFLHILEHCVLTQPAVGIAITFGVNTFRISDDIIYFLGEKFSSLLLQKIIIITLNTMERVQNSWNSLFERMLWSFFGKILNVNFLGLYFAQMLFLFGCIYREINFQSIIMEKKSFNTYILSKNVMKHVIITHSSPFLPRLLQPCYYIANPKLGIFELYSLFQRLWYFVYLLFFPDCTYV